MVKNVRGKFIFLTATCFLIVFISFFWGFAAGYMNVPPGGRLVAIYNELFDYFTFSDGPAKTVLDKVVLEPQEQTSKYTSSGFVVHDDGFQDNGYLLLSRYSKEHRQAIVELISLANWEILHTWIPPVDEIVNIIQNAKSISFKILPDWLNVFHPLLLDNGDLIFTTGEGPMIRMDSCGRIVWSIDKRFHHSIELDYKGNIVCPLLLKEGYVDNRHHLRTDGFAVISPAGKIIKEYSVNELLLSNGYRGLFLGVGSIEHDRLHINDAQPILVDNADARIGDVLLSSRHLSTVLLFDPVTGKIKWLKTGPWLNQHDINQLADGRYSIFGNDVIRPPEGRPFFADETSSRIYIYDSARDSVSQPFNKVMQSMRIGTLTGGRLTILGNGDALIEETDYCRLIRISENKVRWEYVNSVSTNTAGIIHGSRYLTKNKTPLKWLESKTCKE